MDVRGLFEGLEVEGLVPLDQVPNLSINTEKLPTLQGWGPGIVEQTPTPTKLATTPEPTPKAFQEVSEPTSEPEPVSTPKESRSAPPTAFDKMAAIARRILMENRDIVEGILEHLRT